MINHQSPYGQIIRIPTETYFKLLEKDALNEIEEKYANSNRNIINMSASFEADDEYIIDDIADEYKNLYDE